MTLIRSVFALTTTVLALTAAAHAQAQSAEQDAIKTVGRAESEALNRRNAEAQQVTRVQDSAAARSTAESWSYGIDASGKKITRSHFGSFRTAIEDRPDATGSIDITVERPDVTIENCKSAVTTGPNSWSVYDRLGRAYAAAGDVKRAIECYDKSVTLNPKNETGLTALMKLQNQDAVRRSSPYSQP